MSVQAKIVEIRDEYIQRVAVRMSKAMGSSNAHKDIAAGVAGRLLSECADAWEKAFVDLHQEALKKVRTTEHGIEVVLEEAVPITKEIMDIVFEDGWGEGVSDFDIEQKAYAARISRRITTALMFDRAHASLIVEGFRERSQQRYKEHKEEIEWQIKHAMHLIAKEHGSDSKIYKDVCEAFKR